ncbi:hypothetical protein RC1_0314 [Rhodospirillum centenum SW]|uniref:Uncharacterized protein n=1 Tax=Rhodospirillum centenum (strain ATCC 51521 / SW) TaxID=414684 RepID=B6IQM7_RHOCS|nr:hypothetical protein RC1_0314 [Rhodospirillum centenum SW]
MGGACRGRPGYPPVRRRRPLMDACSTPPLSRPATDAMP